MNNSECSDDKITMLFGSDFHFGTYAVSQEDMAKAFSEVIFKRIPDVDIFFINGDFFDREVIFDSCSFDYIYDTILNLFALCEKHQTKLRVLQGTWTHDRGQCKRFEAFYRNHSCTFDFKFVDSIDLEIIKFDSRELKFFYVPDNLPFTSSDEIVSILKEKMRERGWEEIDYGCMHGFFEFTFPKNVNQSGRIVFRKDQFPFVKKIIDVGHVHQFRQDDFIFSNGSFDRSCHGDEDKKGCIEVVDYPDHYTAKFIENHLASVFDSIIIDGGWDTEVISDTIKNHLKNLDHSRQIHLRFVVDKQEQYEAIKSFMRNNYPSIKIARKKVGDKDDNDTLISLSSLITDDEKLIAPTRKTIASFIKSYLPEDDPLTVDKIEFHLDSPV